MRTHVGQSGDEHFAVAHLAGLRGTHDRVEHELQFRIGDDDFEFDLGDEIDLILGAAVHFGVALLPAETANFGYRHAGNALVR